MVAALAATDLVGSSRASKIQRLDALEGCSRSVATVNVFNAGFSVDKGAP